MCYGRRLLCKAQRQNLSDHSNCQLYRRRRCRLQNQGTSTGHGPTGQKDRVHLEREFLQPAAPRSRERRYASELGGRSRRRWKARSPSALALAPHGRNIPVTSFHAYQRPPDFFVFASRESWVLITLTI